MLDSAIHAANSIKDITSGFSETFKKELEFRILRVTLINEYYRRLWTIDDETESALFQEVEKYRKIVGEEKWDEINRLAEDLEAQDGLKTRKEILDNPLISVLVPAGLESNDYQNLLSTLYFQVCPNFEVIIDASYKSDTAEEYLKILQSCLASGKAYDSDKPEIPSEDWDFEFSKWQAKYKSTFGRQLATEQMPQLSLQELVSIIKQCLNNGKAYEYLELPEYAIS